MIEGAYRRKAEVRRSRLWVWRTATKAGLQSIRRHIVHGDFPLPEPPEPPNLAAMTGWGEDEDPVSDDIEDSPDNTTTARRGAVATRQW